MKINLTLRLPFSLVLIGCKGVFPCIGRPDTCRGAAGMRRLAYTHAHGEL